MSKKELRKKVNELIVSFEGNVLPKLLEQLKTGSSAWAHFNCAMNTYNNLLSLKSIFTDYDINEEYDKFEHCNAEPDVIQHKET